jgi:hypothetical protein
LLWVLLLLNSQQKTESRANPQLDMVDWSQVATQPSEDLMDRLKSFTKHNNYNLALERLSWGIEAYEIFKSTFGPFLSEEALAAARRNIIAAELEETGWTEEELMN